MSSSDPTDVNASPLPPEKPSVDRSLPPVEPPTAGFIMQLFLIPMIIVTIIVMVWLAVNWLAHMGSDPYELARNLTRVNDKSWQDAATLADLLRNPRHEHLKSDRRLAQELARVLETQIDAGGMSDEEIKLRIFVARALGEFAVPDGLPALVKAAQAEREPAESDVRRTALEALAVLASNVGPETLQNDPELMRAVLEASRERATDNDPEDRRAKLRERAAFALGVIGGEAARDRLALMLADPYANARFNAATGLARHGDERAVPIILEMLDPQSSQAVGDEALAEGREWKRLQVLTNGIRAAELLAERNPRADLQALEAALRSLVQSELDSLTAGIRRGVRVDAQEALQQIEQL